MLNSKQRELATRWLETLQKEKSKPGWSNSFEMSLVFQALAHWTGLDIASFDVKKILDEIARDNEVQLDQFEAAAANYAETKHQKRPAHHPWDFVVPFQIAFEKRKPRFKILGCVFSFLERKQVTAILKRQPPKEPVDHHFDLILNKKPYQSYVHFSSTGETSDEAWLKVNQAYDAFLGLLEFTFNVGKQSYHYGRLGVAMTHFPRPKWVITVRREISSELKWFKMEYGDYEEQQTKAIGQHQCKVLTHNAHSLRKLPEAGSINSLITDGLRLYAQALDGRQAHSRLIGLWQLAEALTLSENFDGKTDTVCKRLLAFEPIWMIDTDALKMNLHGIAKKRNRVVHHGNHSIVTDSDVNTLKVAVESLLFRLIGNAKRLKTISVLENYYSLHSSSDANLKALGDTLLFLRSTRREKTGRKAT
jgi:hypothetical protein